MPIWWGVIPLLCKNSYDVTRFATETNAHVVSVHYQLARANMRQKRCVCACVCVYIYIYIYIHTIYAIYTVCTNIRMQYVCVYIRICTIYMLFILYMQTLECILKDQYISVKHNISAISGFRLEAGENYALLGYYAASGGNCLPTFRDNQSVPSSGVKKNGSWPWKMVLLTFENGTDRLSWGVGKKLPSLAA